MLRQDQSPDDPGSPGGIRYRSAGTAPDGTPLFQDPNGDLFVQSPTGGFVPYAPGTRTGPGQAEGRINPTPAPPPAAPPPVGGGAPGGAPSGGLLGPFGPFTGGSPFGPGSEFQPLQGTPTQWTPIPQAPQWKDIPTFTAPTMAQAEQDPGYQFGKRQGEEALTQDKAQQGLLYGGGTLKDILAWGSNYATQRYNDVYNRDRDQYMLNTQNQFVLPFQQQMAQWQTLVPAAQRQNEFLQNTNYQKWLQDYNMWNANRSYALDAASRLG